MIVITGVGRSGTSFVASLYRELGFDPGGSWVPSWNGGYEADDIVALNGAILGEFGLSVTCPRLPVGDTARHAARRLLPAGARSAVRRRLMAGRQPNLLPWERFDEVVDKYRSELLAASAKHEVTKDPLFCWTLSVWAAAGVDLEHVVLCLRRIDSAVASWKTAFAVGFSDAAIRNSFAYGLGLFMTTMADYGLPYGVVRFPEHLERPGDLFKAMRFPREVSRPEFLEAYHRIANTEWVHH